MYFKSRQQAGTQLAEALLAYKNIPDTLLMALPRGGVPVAVEVGEALGLPLDVMLVRKLGAPGQPELAMGAITLEGPCVINGHILKELQISEKALDTVLATEKAELERRNALYRHNKPAPDFQDKTVIIIDDGLATGATMKAAISAVSKAGATNVIAAVPVGAADTCDELRPIVQEVICLHTPAPFWSVGHWYENFTQVTDEQVQTLLGSD